jgi:hypothetical protein
LLSSVAANENEIALSPEPVGRGAYRDAGDDKEIEDPFSTGALLPSTADII